MDLTDHRNYRILSEIDAGRPVSQRSLSRELGIALGLTNHLVRRLVSKGFVKVESAIRGGRVHYLLTPRGIAEKSRLTAAYLERTIKLYTETRDLIRDCLDSVAPLDGDSGRDRCRIAFYGAGEIAEIAYIALDRSRFDFIGIADDSADGRDFLGHDFSNPKELLSDDGDRFDYVLITALQDEDQTESQLQQLNIPSEKILSIKRP